MRSTLAASLVPVVLLACSSGLETTETQRSDTPVLKSSLEWVIATDTGLPHPLPIDVRLLDVHPEGGLLPPGSERHGSVAPSPLLRELAANLPSIRLVEPSEWQEQPLVVSLGEPVWISDSEASVYVAYARPASPRYLALFYRYDLKRSGDGTWTVTDVKYLLTEG